MIALFALLGILLLITLYLVWNNSFKHSSDDTQVNPKKLPKAK